MSLNNRYWYRANSFSKTLVEIITLTNLELVVSYQRRTLNTISQNWTTHLSFRAHHKTPFFLHDNLVGLILNWIARMELRGNSVWLSCLSVFLSYWLNVSSLSGLLSELPLKCSRLFPRLNFKFRSLPNSMSIMSSTVKCKLCFVAPPLNWGVLGCMCFMLLDLVSKIWQGRGQIKKIFKNWILNFW